ncbi:MAG: aldose epimerase family protein [Gaiellaceae bacterium]
MRSPGGLVATVLPFGAILHELWTPDRNGDLANVVLALPSPDDYLAGNAGYLGAIVGRYANRIARGRFALGGRTYHVPVNDPPNALHGGGRGFDRRMWRVERATREAVTLGYTSADGEEGFPGSLAVEATYTLSDEGLRLELRATTDAPTVVNLASHTYWNLGGGGAIDDHVLQVDAARYTPVDETGIPTGELAPVAATRFDLREARAIGRRAYDHNFVLDGAARLHDPVNGRTLVIETTEPGLQVYTGEKLERPRAAIALETQHFPDSPNQPGFPSVVLRPGEVFASATSFTFSASA